MLILEEEHINWGVVVVVVGGQVHVFIVCTYGRKARLMRGAGKEAGGYSGAARTLISI